MNIKTKRYKLYKTRIEPLLKQADKNIRDLRIEYRKIRPKNENCQICQLPQDKVRNGCCLRCFDEFIEKKSKEDRQKIIDKFTPEK
jgi:hypothetical protein